MGKYSTQGMTSEPHPLWVERQKLRAHEQARRMEARASYERMLQNAAAPFYRMEELAPVKHPMVVGATRGSLVHGLFGSLIFP